MWIVGISNVTSQGGLNFVDVCYRSFPAIWKKRHRRAFNKPKTENYFWLDNGSPCPDVCGEFYSYCKVGRLVTRYHNEQVALKAANMAQTVYLTGVDIADVE